ncbi:hypothetical protein EB118_01785 [bacterium]|nr:hypothetical protein [bacterium]NBX97937.1 hypothetical protein [bacterium]NDC94635.1 hypothetical protein [bacterium]NDD83774.1 hypothetical protein [bacterium]NDG28819.1 hypothetical protein [bacterium]
MSDYWQQQTNEPLFKEILWSRPENKQQSGKLLIIGGNKFGFAAPAEAYTNAENSGAGAIRVLLPEALEKIVGHGAFDAYYAPTNLSGSFSKQALDSMLVQASWSDYALVAGDLGKNSETAVLLDSFIKKYSGPLCITKDAVDYFIQTPTELLKREHTTIVASYEQLQKIGIHNGNTVPLTFGMPAPAVAEWLHLLTLHIKSIIVTYHNNQLFVADNGRVVSQVDKIYTEKIWRVATAAKASVFVMQNPTQPLEAVATSWL